MLNTRMCSLTLVILELLKGMHCADMPASTPLSRGCTPGSLEYSEKRPCLDRSNRDHISLGIGRDGGTLHQAEKHTPRKTDSSFYKQYSSQSAGFKRPRIGPVQLSISKDANDVIEGYELPLSGGKTPDTAGSGDDTAQEAPPHDTPQNQFHLKSRALTFRTPSRLSPAPAIQSLSSPSSHAESSPSEQRAAARSHTLSYKEVSYTDLASREMELGRTLPGPAGAMMKAMAAGLQSVNVYDEKLESSMEATTLKPTTNLLDAFHSPASASDFSGGPWMSAIYALGMNEGHSIQVTPRPSIKDVLIDPSSMRISKLAGVVTGAALHGKTGAVITLNDPTGSIQATVHPKVLTEPKFAQSLACGAAMILHQVVVFRPRPGFQCLNITLSNIVQIFGVDTVVPVRPRRDQPVAPDVCLQPRLLLVAGVATKKGLLLQQGEYPSHPPHPHSTPGGPSPAAVTNEAEWDFLGDPLPEVPALPSLSRRAALCPRAVPGPPDSPPLSLSRGVSHVSEKKLPSQTPTSIRGPGGGAGEGGALQQMAREHQEELALEVVRSPPPAGSPSPFRKVPLLQQGPTSKTRLGAGAMPGESLLLPGRDVRQALTGGGCASVGYGAGGLGLEQDLGRYHLAGAEAHALDYGDGGGTGHLGGEPTVGRQMARAGPQSSLAVSSRFGISAHQAHDSSDSSGTQLRYREGSTDACQIHFAEPQNDGAAGAAARVSQLAEESKGGPALGSRLPSSFSRPVHVNNDLGKIVGRDSGRRAGEDWHVGGSTHGPRHGQWHSPDGRPGAFAQVVSESTLSLGTQFRSTQEAVAAAGWAEEDLQTLLDDDFDDMNILPTMPQT